MAMRKICFIDDDAVFEVPLFRETFFDEFDLLCGTSFEEVYTQIKSRKDWQPDLFVLDMYSGVGAPDQATIRMLADNKLELPADRGQLREAFRNYVAATDRFRALLHAWKQDAQGGQDLARKVNTAFPHTPIVFYSRKAILEDAVRCMQQNEVVKVLLKPTGPSDEETKALTKREASRLANEFREAMNISSDKLSKIKEASRFVATLLGDFFRPRL